MIGLNELIVKLAIHKNDPLYIAIKEKDVEKLLYLIDKGHKEEINDPDTIPENIDIDKMHEEVNKLRPFKEQRRRWTPEEDKKLISIIKTEIKYSELRFACKVAAQLLNRTPIACKRRYDKLLESGKINKMWTIDKSDITDSNLNVGDFVEYKDYRWIVINVDHHNTHSTCDLMNGYQEQEWHVDIEDVKLISKCK